MTKLEEVELFDYLSRQHKLREWLNDQLTVDVSILTQALDIDQLRRAQGRCGLLNQMIGLLDKAPTVIKR